MPRYLVKLDLGDDEEVREYIVHAPDAEAAQRKTISYGHTLIDAKVIGERTGPEEEDELMFDGILE
jgi:hypothetical protein